MNIVDLLVTIVVVTILVTIILAVITYIAYKLRLSREPDSAYEPDGPRYFIEYRPPNAGTTEAGAAAAHETGVAAGAATSGGPASAGPAAAPTRSEAHATEA